MSRTKIYHIWGGMKSRCKSKRDKEKGYIEKGITVCERWQKFENFYKDMGDKPDGMDIDRIDNNKGYYKENCRWATKSLNAFNKVKFAPRNNDLPRGVHKHIKNKKYYAMIYIGGRNKNLGTFFTPEEASRAYEVAYIQLNKELPPRQGGVS